MQDLVQKLHRDHTRLAQVLFQLDQDLAECHQCDHCELHMLARFRDALSYIQEYPLHWHHPVEEAIYERLLQKNIPEWQIIERTQRQHESMEEETRKLIDDFQTLLNEGMGPPASLLHETAELIARQLDHQHRENTEVFPLIEKYLNTREWQEIELRCYDVPHCAAIQRHYLSLYHHLTHHSSRSTV